MNFVSKILIATTNKGKLKEIAEYLQDLPVEFVSLGDLGITHEVVEDGDTYHHNSQKKAKEYATLSGLPAISDDGGLEIDALGGEPGVNSRYWAGLPGRDEDIIEKMKQVARDLPDNNRNAQFTTVLTLAFPDGRYWSVEDSINGIIAKEGLVSAMQGFPYRSFFYLPELGKYYHESELNDEEKKTYNHRYKAIQKLKEVIKKELQMQ